MSKRVLIVGGTGRLGSALAVELGKYGHEVCAATRESLDVTSPFSIRQAMDFDPDVTINCAGVLSMAAESDQERAWEVNALGAGKLAFWTRGRLVHISTDYVFSGEKGESYIEADVPDPVNYYGFTKAAGEAAVLAADPCALVLRAPFRYDGPWPYAKAFADQFISGRWMREVVPDIAAAAMDRALVGILHIGGPRRSVYEMAREVSPEVQPCDRAEWTGMRIPRDTTLDSSRWARLQNAAA